MLRDGGFGVGVGTRTGEMAEVDFAGVLLGLMIPICSS